MKNILASPLSQLAGKCLLLLALFAFIPTAAQAQVVFDIELSEKGKKAVTDPDRMNAEALVDLLSEEGRIVFSGPSGTGKTMEKRNNSFGVNQTHFIVGADGKTYGRVQGKSAKAGTHSMAKSFPRGQLLSVLKRSFPDSVFFPDTIFFPDFLFTSEKQFPDSFDNMKLQKGQIAIVSAVMSTDRDRKVQSRPMVMVFNTKG